jgi:hypothetical protein
MMDCVYEGYRPASGTGWGFLDRFCYVHATKISCTRANLGHQLTGGCASVMFNMGVVMISPTFCTLGFHLSFIFMGLGCQPYFDQ